MLLLKKGGVIALNKLTIRNIIIPSYIASIHGAYFEEGVPDVVGKWRKVYKKLPMSAKYLYGVLHTFRSSNIQHQDIYPNYEHLMQYMCCSRQTVSNAIKVLSEFKLITVGEGVSENGMFKSNNYRLYYPNESALVYYDFERKVLDGKMYDFKYKIK